MVNPSEQNSRDARLISAYLKGDETALEELFELYRLPFYAYFNRMLNGDTVTADDLFQELWLKLIDNLAKCRDHERFAAWAFAIAHRELMQHFRRDRRSLWRLTPDGNLPEMAMEDDLPGVNMDDKALQLKLEDALNHLSPEQLEVFHLRQQGIGFKEIAEIQSCPLNTALGRMRQTMEKLSTLLREDQYE